MIRKYAEWIEENVSPWLRDEVKQVTVTASDGIRINGYYALHPSEKASVLMIHGFCEFFGKYHETAYRFWQAGYSVFFIELRGHGKSERTAQYEQGGVHVDSFSEYIDDVRSFIDQVVEPETVTGDLFLFAHSMGGAVGALLLEEYPSFFRCGVLSSPMLKMDFGRVPEMAVRAMAVYSNLRNITEKYAPGQHSFTGEYLFDDSSALSEERYMYQFDQRLQDPDYRTWGGTFGWVRAAREASRQAVKNAGQLKVTVLLCQAGKDTVVDNAGQNEFALLSDHVVLRRYENARHEIYNAGDEEREKYYKDILTFFGSFCSRKGG